MTATATPPTTASRLERVWSDEPGIVGFIRSVDHKRIGIRYLVTSLVFLVLGGVQALAMRAQLAAPGSDLLSPQVYNQMMTMHGVTMIFLFNTPVWAGFGNYFLPLQIGTRDMAFPRLNALSYWIFLGSGIFIYTSFFIGSIPDGGWFAYVPLTGEQWSPNAAIDYWAVGLAFLGISTTVGAVNFIVTTFKMRAPGMTASRLPIFVWAIVVMAFMILLAVPAVTMAQALLELDRALGFSFFVPEAGGEPLLYQHLFWIWGHPEVYIVFVPATGIVSMVVSTFSRTRLVGHLMVVTALVAIGFISFGVWAHHMFVTGIGFLALSFFAAASFLVAIPSGVQFFSWIATLWEGRPSFRTPMLWALGMMFIFLLGGITGVMVAMVPFDFQAHDSYFVVAHFHYVLVGGSMFPVFAGLYHWFPKMTGRMPDERVGAWAFWITFVSFNVTFFPLHLLGLWGMPRRVYTYQEGLGWGGINLVSTIGSFALGIGIVLALGSLLWSRFRGPPADPDPWGGDTLEWATASPTPTYNFVELPRVTSRHPLWEPEMARVGAEEEPSHDRPVLLPPEGVAEHYTLQTGGVDAEPEHVLPMPAPTAWPAVLAFGMLLLAYGILARSWLLLIAPGVVLIVAAFLGWHWPAHAEPLELDDEDLTEALR